MKTRYKLTIGAALIGAVIAIGGCAQMDPRNGLGLADAFEARQYQSAIDRYAERAEQRHAELLYQLNRIETRHQADHAIQSGAADVGYEVEWYQGREPLNIPAYDPGRRASCAALSAADGCPNSGLRARSAFQSLTRQTVGETDYEPWDWKDADGY